jgi:hypothetical protein
LSIPVTEPSGTSASNRSVTNPLAQRERESGGVVKDEHAVLARLRLGHEAEVLHVEASRTPLIRDGESKMVH